MRHDETLKITEIIMTHVFCVERVRYYHARLPRWDVYAFPILTLVLGDEHIAHYHIMIDDSLRDKR